MAKRSRVRRDILGKKLWNYRVDYVLGTGGNASVYAAHDEKSGRDVAIKILPEDFDASVLSRFKQETKALSRLNHPNIVPILDIGSEGETHYYVMELVNGQTLRELLETRRKEGPRALSPEEGLRIARDICAALACSHEEGIFHRDIKPSNVLLERDLSARLTDFGLAKVVDDATLTQAGTLMGTPLYMSPEQLHGGDVDHRSDIYQVGLLLYEMLVGRLPFTESNPYVAATRRLTDPIPPVRQSRPSIPPPVEDLIEGCLRRDRLKRPSSAKELLRSIEAVLRGVQSSSATPALDTTVTPQVLSRWLTPSRSPAARGVWTGLALAGLVLALGGFALFGPFWSGQASVQFQGPSVITPDPYTAIVRYRTEPPLRSEILYGLHEEEPDRFLMVTSQPDRSHEGILAGLEPGSTYHYSVRLITSEGRLLPTRRWSFETPPRQ